MGKRGVETEIKSGKIIQEYLQLRKLNLAKMLIDKVFHYLGNGVSGWDVRLLETGVEVEEVGTNVGMWSDNDSRR